MTYKHNPFIRKVRIDYNRMDDVEQSGAKAHFGEDAIGYHKASELLAMACENIYPDGTYSDFECNVWSAFRSILLSEQLLNKPES